MYQPKLLWALLCDRYEIDPSNHKLMILGQFDAIAARSFPVLAPPSWLLTKWVVDPRSRVTLRYILKFPDTADGDGHVIAASASDGEVGLFNAFYLHAQSLEGLLFSQPGDYTVEIYANDILAHTLTFPVIPED